MPPHNDTAVTAAEDKLITTFGQVTIKRLPVTLKIHRIFLVRQVLPRVCYIPAPVPIPPSKKEGHKISSKLLN